MIAWLESLPLGARALVTAVVLLAVACAVLVDLWLEARWAYRRARADVAILRLLVESSERAARDARRELSECGSLPATVRFLEIEKNNDPEAA